LIIELTLFSIVLFITTLINLTTTNISWQRRKARGGSYFTWGMVAVTLWTLAAAFDYAAGPVPLKVLWGVISGYLMIFVMLVCVWQAMQQGSALIRRQERLLMAVIIFTILSNLVYLIRIPAIDGIDFSSISFSISGLLMIAALYGTRFLDIVPIARNKIIEKIDDGILVLDTEDHLVDFNIAAQKIFRLNRVHLGSPIGSLMAGWPQVIELISQPGKTRSQVEAALRVSEERYRTVADYIYNWEYWLTPDGTFQYISPSCERITGYCAEEFIADPALLVKIVFPEDRELWENHQVEMSHQSDQNILYESVFRILRRDGEIRWIAHTCHKIDQVRPGTPRAGNTPLYPTSVGMRSGRRRDRLRYHPGAPGRRGAAIHAPAGRADRRRSQGKFSARPGYTRVPGGTFYVNLTGF
jgi:PAS domain S-box-containing protein